MFERDGAHRAGHGALTADHVGEGRDLVVLHSLLADRHAFDPVALNKAIEEKVAGSRCAELPGCGHCPPIEQPEAFIAAIKEFVGL